MMLHRTGQPPTHKPTVILFMNHVTIYLGILLVAFAFGGCRRSQQSTNESANDGKRYAFYVRSRDGREYFKITDDLTSGILRPVSDGQLLDKMNIGRELMIVRDNLYHFDYQSHILRKLALQGEELGVSQSLSMSEFSLENFMVRGDSLLLLGLDTTYSRPLFSWIDTRHMRIIREGILPLPLSTSGENSISIGFSYLTGDTLLVGYNFVSVNKQEYRASDTIRTAAMRIPSMELIQVSGEARSTYPGGLNTIQPYSFADENGDFYFVSSPGILLGHREDHPTAIFRIRKGSVTTDPTYMVDIKTAIGDDAYGMWYLGNGKAIVRSEKHGSFQGWNDYHNVHQFSYYTVNLGTGVMERLALPMDKGGRKDAVLVEDGQALISVNSSTEGNYIWVYDLSNGALSKGLRLEDQVDYIFRFDRLP